MVAIPFPTTQPEECARELPGDPLIRARVPFVRAPQCPCSTVCTERTSALASRKRTQMYQTGKVLDLTRE